MRRTEARRRVQTGSEPSADAQDPVPIRSVLAPTDTLASQTCKTAVWRAHDNPQISHTGCGI